MQQPLLAWAARHGRDLPWRRTRDPWAVLVSELMLQQTQVPRVVPRYAAFLARFPTAAACAAAPAGEVVRQWAGLGYYRRAVSLHGAAVACVDRHGGALPDTLEGLRALPCVGAYTARAVLAFAHGRDVGVLDTNAARVLARLHGRRLAPAEAQRAADALVPAGRGWEWNQALLDLGATVCVRPEPGCGRCPVRAACAWAAAGRPPPDPSVGSAGSSTPQPAFAGSDRQGRGRLVRALASGPVAADGLAAVMGWPDDPERAHRVARSMAADGVVVLADGWVRLP